jgi:hypothetical protein
VTQERTERVAHNELVFRRANERLREDWRRLGIDDNDTGLFLCECADVTCKVPLRITVADYEAVRADPDAFLLVPGHEDASIETVAHDLVPGDRSFTVVRKHRSEGQS